MIKFNKPKNLNGFELLSELKSVGIDVIDYPLVDGNDDLWLDINSADENVAAEIVKVHNGTTVAPELKIEEKLALVGLNLDDLKAALGL